MTTETHDEEYNIHWIEDIVQKVLARDVNSYLINSGKSVSASVHIGFMREVIICDVIKRELQRLGRTVKTMFMVDDYDPLRKVPSTVPKSFKEYMGIPYSDIPFDEDETYGEHWGNELIETFPEFGVDPEIVWHHEIYETPEMLKAVRTCLRETDVIRELLIEIVAADFAEEQRKDYVKSMENWYPASVVCPKCGRLQAGAKGSIVPNRITKYDAETDEVSFSCPHCGHQATLPLNEVRVKLTWRVDWPAKWYVYKVTCEPAGKDHAVKGGSYDTGLEISRRVFDWEGPVPVPFEWARIGGRDMSTSEGIVFSPRVWLNIAPAELFRYLMLRTDLERAINIQPERIPDMVDEYDRFERMYYGLEETSEEKKQLVEILYPLCTVEPVTKKYIPKLPFKFAVVTSQLKELLGEEVILKRSRNALRQQYNLADVSKEVEQSMRRRLEKARNWVEMYGTKRDKVAVPDEVPASIIQTLTDKDRAFLKEMIEVLAKQHPNDDALQSDIFEAARNVGLKERRAFMVFYRILISRKSGPRLAPFISLLGKEWVAERIASISD